jgi:hypothetical protein
MTVKTHFRIVFRGIFDGSPEIWSYSTKWGRARPLGTDATLEDIDTDAVSAAAAAFHEDTMFQSNVKLTEWRAYVIGTDGKMEGDPLLVDLSTDPSSGTGTTRAYPTNVALCVTTVGEHRGHGRYGRFYLPGPHAQLDSDRHIAVSWLDPVVTRTVTFLKAVSNSIDLPGEIGSSEMLNISNDATGTFQNVQSIKVGRVLDSIERRRNALTEDYHDSGHIDW